MVSHDSVMLEELTWVEVERALDAGIRTIVFGVGSIEQHGAHLPLRMDTLAGEELTRLVAERLGDALVAPTIRPGCSGHHMEFPGTLSVPPEVLMDTIRSYCRSLDRHGFEEIVIIPTHGGNFAPVNTVAPDIAKEIAADILAIADLQEMMRIMNAALKDAGVEYQEPVIHAGAVETAIVMAVDDQQVRTEELAVGHEGAVSVPRLLGEGFQSITDTGVLGDPRKATPEAGETILEHLSEAYVDRIRVELRGD